MKHCFYTFTAKSPRHIGNEDSHAVGDCFAIVADGMGGEGNGDIASRLAVDAISSFLRENAKDCSSESGAMEMMRRAILCANGKITSFIDSNPESMGMGTTVLILFIYGGNALICWCGDSHCYSYKGGKLQSLTKDHSYVQELIDKGMITIDESFSHPDSCVITRFVGGEEEDCEPDFRTVPLSSSELFILCSDGLSGYCRKEEIEKAVAQNKDIAMLPKELHELAISHGSDDDFTLILVSPRPYQKSKSLLGWLKSLALS